MGGASRGRLYSHNRRSSVQYRKYRSRNRSEAHDEKCFCGKHDASETLRRTRGNDSGRSFNLETVVSERPDSDCGEGESYITALKMAARNLRVNNTYLGAQFRRLRTKLGTPIAIKAMAAKLARLVYRILHHGIKYVDRGAAFYEAQHRQLQIKLTKECGWKDSDRSDLALT